MVRQVADETNFDIVVNPNPMPNERWRIRVQPSHQDRPMHTILTLRVRVGTETGEARMSFRRGEPFFPDYIYPYLRKRAWDNLMEDEVRERFTSIPR